MIRTHLWILAATGICLMPRPIRADGIEVAETDDRVIIATEQLEAVVRKRGYVSGIAGGSLLDKRTGLRDAGHGLSIADFIMEPGSDAEYRDRIAPRLTYEFNTPVHGARAKRMIEGPQICTMAKELHPRIIRGSDFVAVVMQHKYPQAAPGRVAGSQWTQTLVFPAGKRYYLSSQRIDTVNRSPAMFFRVDMPGHIKHDRGDTFSEIYLSYFDKRIPSTEFFETFAPDERFNYRRDRAGALPKRFIRAYRLRDAKTGRRGPWLAGMTLDASVVHEAWCHQRPAGAGRGYVCMIEEFGGRPIEPGEHFSAAFIVGYFDSIDEMHQVYDQHAGHTGLSVDEKGWRLTKVRGQGSGVRGQDFQLRMKRPRTVFRGESGVGVTF